MIASFTEVLEAARRRRCAVPAFTCYDAETAAGVLRAAAGRPLIVLVSANLVTAPAGSLLVAALHGMASRAPSPVCLQLDHAHDLDVVRIGCALGLGAVMADGSHLPYAENVAFVLAARVIAARHGVPVEAELGHIEGDEETARPADPGELTDPAQASAFARDTGADCLAVSVGNVHGTYRGAPRLDLPRLREIAARVDVPLVLHGGSGLPGAALRAAVAAGIAKCNLNTELREAYLATTAEQLPASLDGARLLALHQAQREAVEVAAARRFRELGAPAISARP
jgi:tagatose 1,6-diphosphate aldolase GatY/KbaY